MLLPILLAAFAFAGAPQVPVTCTTSVPFNEYGWAEWAPVPQVLLAPSTCAGLAYLGAGAGVRFVIRRRAPFTYWPGQAGVSALVMLHESSHIAGVHDETDAECRAVALLPAFVGRYLAGVELEAAIRTAHNYDATLPAIYHERACA